jgi:Fic family protein
MTQYPVFEYLPFESLISNTQEEYYKALMLSDQSANSTPFIEYLLNVIDNSLAELLAFNGRRLTTDERLEYISELGIKEFSRKEYMNIFKSISSATASRDLKKGVEKGILKVSGEKNKTRYTL